MFLSEYGASWLDFKLREVGAATLYTYNRILRDAVIPALGDRELGSISPIDVQNLLNQALDRFSENEALKTRALLKGMFRHAHELELIPSNPAAKIRLPKGSGAQTVTIRSVPSTVDARAMSIAIDRSYRLMPLLAAFAGLRWQEVAALKAGDFDLESRQLQIERALGRYEGIKEPKSAAGIRTTLWAEEVHNEVLDVVTGLAPQTWLFSSVEGSRLQYSNWRRRVWVPACDRVGLRWTFHQYRHTFAVESLRRGRAVQTVAVMMGHTNPRVTWEFYAGLVDDHLEEARRAW